MQITQIRMHNAISIILRTNILQQARQYVIILLNEFLRDYDWTSNVQ